MNSRKTKKRIERLCQEFGISVVWKNNNEKMWCPKTRTIYREDGSNVIHELSHFIVAEKKRRRMINFGCGSDYEYLQPSIARISYADSEEEHASALGIMIEKALGMRWKETANLHTWTDFGPDMKNKLTEYSMPWMFAIEMANEIKGAK